MHSGGSVKILLTRAKDIPDPVRGGGVYHYAYDYSHLAQQAWAEGRDRGWRKERIVCIKRLTIHIASLQG